MGDYVAVNTAGDLAKDCLYLVELGGIGWRTVLRTEVSGSTITVFLNTGTGEGEFPQYHGVSEEVTAWAPKWPMCDGELDDHTRPTGKRRCQTFMFDGRTCPNSHTHV